MIMETVPQSERVILFLDCINQQLMKNQNITIEMWNKICIGIETTMQSRVGIPNSIIGQQQPCFSAGKVIKRRSKVCTLANEMKGTWTVWSITEKRRKKKDDSIQ